MSRLGKLPVEIPSGVTATVNGALLSIKGPKGELSFNVPETVTLSHEDNALTVKPSDETKKARAMWGTARAHILNMVNGVSNGFTKNLELVGVGYRAQAQGNKLNLSLGFSHPVVYSVPEGITVETPSQTEIVIRGSDKQVVGQVAAEIRGVRPPEPYKGKGVRYANERVRIKEAKKK